MDPGIHFDDDDDDDDEDEDFVDGKILNICLHNT